MKKLMALLLAGLMILSMSTAVMAAQGDYTTPDLSSHTYTAYQIFSGTQAENAAELGNITWGSGVNGDALLEALKADSAFGQNEKNLFADCTTAEQVAEVMKNWFYDSAEAKAFAKDAFANKAGNGTAVVAGDTLNAGYYLIVDTTTGPVEIYNLALLQLTQRGALEIATKVEVPSVEKELSDASYLKDPEVEHTHTKECYNWKKANDVSIGDTVYFKLTSAVPAKADDYDFYYFILTDTLSAGFNKPQNVQVFIGDSTTAAVVTEDYTYKISDAAPYTLEVALTNATAHKGEAVVVTYESSLNEDAIVGVAGNPNEVDLKYSNNPNEKYDGTSEGGFPKEDTTPSLGTTPKRITITYTTEIGVYKIDAKTKQVLPGVEFTLSGNGVNVVLISEEKFTEDAQGTFYKLTDNTYTQTAPITEDTYRQATDADGRTGGYVLNQDGTYSVATDSQLAGDTPLYILVKANASQYVANDDGSYVMYKMETVLKATKATEDLKVTGVVDQNGNLTFRGLGSGTYTLSETKTLPGYNTIEDITFEITCTLPTDVIYGNENCSWAVNIDVDGVETPVPYDAEKKTFKVTIENEKGRLLPETGGVGTTMLYVVGGVMVAAAVVLLVLRKRKTVK